jgi:iron complex transport system substrate-binding protein
MRLVFLARRFYFLRQRIETMTIPDPRRASPGANAEIRKRVLAAICKATAMLLFLCDGAAARQTSGAQATPPPGREARDETGRQVKIPQKVERVVSLAPNLTEIVFALGEGNHLAGDTDFCDYPPEARQKRHVGGPVNPNLEEIVSLMPDLILATSINRRETVTALDRLGLPVYVTDPQSVEEMIATVEHIGNALGVEKSSAALAEDLRGRLADLGRRLDGVIPRRVLFVVWTSPLISVGRETFIADALRLAGARSVVETSEEWPHVSLEEMVRLQPEFLIFAAEHAVDTQRDIDELRTRPGWKDLSAIQQGKIAVLSEAIDRPVPRLVDAVEQLARALHPEVFAARAAPRERQSPDWRFSIANREIGVPRRRLPPTAVQGKKPELQEEACACAR